MIHILKDSITFFRRIHLVDKVEVYVAYTYQIIIFRFQLNGRNLNAFQPIHHRHLYHSQSFQSQHRLRNDDR